MKTKFLLALMLAVAAENAAAAGADTNNGRRSSRPGTWHRDDQGVRSDGRPDGLPVGLGSGNYVAPIPTNSIGIPIHANAVASVNT
jgi:hypothetical protein